MTSTIKAAVAVLGLCALFATTPVSAEEKPSSKIDKKDSKQTVYTVKAGDTLDTIAKDHDMSYTRLFNANDSIENPDVIDVGDKVKIPKKNEKFDDRFSEFMAMHAVANQNVVAQTDTTYTTRSYSSQPVSSESYYVGNGMWCTDYVKSKRPDVPIYGNAGYNWISAAQADGKSTGSKPKAGAVAVMDGHVAYVESVNSDGSYTVSEMGWNYQAGNYNKRTVKAGAFGQFIY